MTARLEPRAPGLAAALAVASLAAAIILAPACQGGGSIAGPEPAEVLWTADVGPLAAGPVVAGGRLYLLDPPFVAARDALTGALLWARELGPGDPAAFPSLTAHGGLVFALHAGLLTAMAGESGDPGWILPGEGGFLTADLERLYWFRPDAIYGLDPPTGRSLWRDPFPGTIGALALGAGLVCFASDRIECRDPAGVPRTLWTAPLAVPSVVVEIEIGVGTVYVGTAAGELRAHDARTGTAIWSRDLGAPLRGVTTAGLVVVACAGDGERGACFALDESNGGVRWELETRGPTSAPVLAGGRVVIVDERGIVVLDLVSGGIVAILDPPLAELHDARLVAAGGVLYARRFGTMVAIALP